MKELLNENRFDFISPTNKGFILAFDEAMTGMGYGFGGSIGSGYCWGRYMVIYTKTGAKSKKVVARLYLRDESILLRLFLNDIDRHREYIEQAPVHIKEVFTGTHGDCQRCHNDKGGVCRFRKSYTLQGRLIEKCNGITFEFPDPNLDKLPDYLGLFREFYAGKKVGKG